MASIQTITSAAKLAALSALLDGKSVKAALYATTSILSLSTPVYTTDEEVYGVNYTPGGVTVPNAAPAILDNDTACWTPSGTIVFSNVTISIPFDTVLLYLPSMANLAIAILKIPVRTVAGGNVTLAMPANDYLNAIIRS